MGLTLLRCSRFAMLTGQLPFQHLANQRPKNLYSKICRADFQFPDERVPRMQTRVADGKGDRENEAAKQQLMPKISEQSKDLVRKILAPNPTRRLTSQGIWQHPWMAGSTARMFSGRAVNGILDVSLSRSSSSSLSARSGLSRGSTSILTPATTPTWPGGGLSNSPLPSTPVVQQSS